MQVEVGDRVRVRHERFAKSDVHHAGWEDHENGPGWGAPIERPSREYWQDAQAVVVSVDPINREVTIRGRHADADFTLILPESSVEVTEQGVPR